MLEKQHSQLLKKMEEKSRSNVKTQSSDINKRKDFGRRSKTEEKANKGKGIQCYECEGFGHIKAECPTFLKKEKKGWSTSWSEDDFSSEGFGSSATGAGAGGARWRRRRAAPGRAFRLPRAVPLHLLAG